MTQRNLISCLLALGVVSCLASGEERSQPSSARVDPVAQTMTKMRVASTLLVDERRKSGTYPLADGMLHPLRDVFASSPAAAGPNEAIDAWGHTIWYRANQEVHQLISYGADGQADEDYAAVRLYSGRFQMVVDAPDPRNDLVMKDGRFVRRPFGSRAREFATINSINDIFIASSSFAVDNNLYPGNVTALTSVSALAADLVPIYIHDLPTQDGWGRPILFSNNGATFMLVSFGEDGIQDQVYYTDLACAVELFDEGISSEQGGDVVQACGRFTHWPRGTEP
jgi:hypothetical protein